MLNIDNTLIATLTVSRYYKGMTNDDLTALQSVTAEMVERLKAYSLPDYSALASYTGNLVPKIDPSIFNLYGTLFSSKFFETLKSIDFDHVDLLRLAHMKHPYLLGKYAKSAVRAHEANDLLGATMALYALIEGYAKESLTRLSELSGTQPRKAHSKALFQSLRDRLLKSYELDEEDKTVLDEIISYWESDDTGSPRNRNSLLHGAIREEPTQDLVYKLVSFATAFTSIYETIDSGRQ